MKTLPALLFAFCLLPSALGQPIITEIKVNPNPDTLPWVVYDERQDEILIWDVHPYRSVSLTFTSEPGYDYWVETKVACLYFPGLPDNGCGWLRVSKSFRGTGSPLSFAHGIPFIHGYFDNVKYRIVCRRN